MSEAQLLDLKRIIIDASINAPRSQQKTIGPSEVGEPCARKLAYKLLDIEPRNTATDPLPSLVGTGAHAWLADAFLAWNEANGRKRFWVEEKVTCGPVVGSCDLYDADTLTAIDHKFPGVTAMDRYRKNGPSDVYRIQAHLYGMGHRDAGRPVEHVAIVFYPRGGMLGDAFMWAEPFDEAIAEAAIERLMGIAAATDVWLSTTGDKAQAIGAIEPTTSRLCNWCEYLSYGSTDLARGCPGEGVPEV